MDKLRDCPLCGREAFIKVQKVEYGLSGTIIKCKNPQCGCMLYVSDARAKFTDGGLKNFPIDNHTEIAIKRWNTRIENI